MPVIKINAEPPKPTTFEDLGYVQVVRCKDCINRGNPKKCLVAYIGDVKSVPYFCVDNSGEFYCADGKRKE